MLGNYTYDLQEKRRKTGGVVRGGSERKAASIKGFSLMSRGRETRWSTTII